MSRRLTREHLSSLNTTDSLVAEHILFFVDELLILCCSGPGSESVINRGNTRPNK
jgi:hypothetical protein